MFFYYTCSCWNKNLKNVIILCASVCKIKLPSTCICKYGKKILWWFFICLIIFIDKLRCQITYIFKIMHFQGHCTHRIILCLTKFFLIPKNFIHLRVFTSNQKPFIFYIFETNDIISLHMVTIQAPLPFI